MNLRYVEDYNAGDVFDLGMYDVTGEEIIEFARKYDPFPFHIDDRAAQEWRAYDRCPGRPRLRGQRFWEAVLRS